MTVVSATEDGSLGHKGRVTEPLEAYLDAARLRPVALYACGPDAMLHAVARIAEERDLPCQVSLDPWMGCGVGHLPRLRGVDPARRRGQSPKYRCACTEGPVFDAEHRGLARRRGLGARAAAEETAMNLSVEVAGIRLKNPLIAASGTFGYGVEYEGILDLSILGGLVSKGLYLEARDGCATPRIVETPSGLLNAIGLQGVGVRALRARTSSRAWRRYDTAVLVNVCGDTVEEYAEVTRILDQAAGRGRRRDQHLLPEREEGRHGLRRRSEDDPRGGLGRAQGDAAAGDSRSSPPTSPTSRCSRELPRRRAPMPSRASTPCWASRSTWRHGGRARLRDRRPVGPRHSARSPCA